MKKYLTEFIGTLFLVATVGNAVLNGTTLAPIPIGLMLMVMIYAGGHVSGAHYNPAVTVAVWLRGRCSTKDAIPYIIAQIAGGVVAALIVGYLRGKGTPGDIQIGPAFVGEMLGTFALAYVVLNSATAKANAGNSFYGAAIGMTVTAAAFALGDLSGGAFNPAVAIGASLMGLIKTSNLWLYLIACPVAGALAAIVFRQINPDDK
ncbi:MAG: aquaporin [Verrucomicrobiales bacterium]|nr:aquaporin [Verrucomicrobiales bacterium]